MHVKDLKEKIAHDEDIMLVDVREADEYQAAVFYLEGAQNISMRNDDNC